MAKEGLISNISGEECLEVELPKWKKDVKTGHYKMLDLFKAKIFGSTQKFKVSLNLIM